MQKIRILSVGMLVITILFVHGFAWAQSQDPIQMEKAQKIVHEYLNDTGNPNLKPGKVKDEGDYFLAEIVTKEGSLVNHIEIDKDTGRVNSRYGLGPGMRVSEYDSAVQGEWNYCPYCGNDFHRGRRYGMRHGGSYGHGGRMMRRGGRYTMGGHMMGHGEQRHRDQMRSGKSIDRDTAKAIVQDYLTSIENPNLKIGKVKEKTAGYEVEIETKKQQDMVDIIRVNKYTGTMRSIY